MNKFFILFFLLLFSQNAVAQKKVSISEIEATMVAPVILKEGKEPKDKRVKVNIYTIVYEAPHTYDIGQHIQFTRYIETYKNKVIRELVFDTGETTGRRLNNIELNIHEIINSYQSTTDMNSICCRFTKNMYALLSNRMNITKINKDEILEDMEFSGNFYNSIPDKDFIEHLKKNKVKENSINEFLSLKKFIDDKFGDRGKTEDLIVALNEEIQSLAIQLERWIPNFESRIKNGVGLAAEGYKKDDIRFIYVTDRYGWKSDFEESKYNLDTGKNNYFMKIIYPEGHQYEGTVYLKNNEDITEYNGYLEVYENNTKNPIPYDRLLVNFKERRVRDNNGPRTKYDIAIYNLKGLLNDSFNKISTHEEFTHAYRTPDIFKDRLNAINDESPTLRYESVTFLRDYMKREIKNRELVYHDYYEKKEAIIQSIIDEYNEAKKNSLAKNGFFLETKNFAEDREDEGIHFFHTWIYEGKFDELISNGWRKDIGYASSSLSAFMRKKAGLCGTYGIPENEIAKIYTTTCSSKDVKKNGFGMVLNERCVEWSEEFTGLYTSRKVYTTYTLVKDHYTSPNNLIEILGDINRMFELNNCSSGGIKRYEENLVRFINGEKPLLL